MSPHRTSFASTRQQEIYRAGKEARVVPAICEDLEMLAAEKMTPEAYDFVTGGAGGEETLRANQAAFEKWKLLPRMLRGVEQPRLSIRLAGRQLPFPVLLAPVGVQGIVHPQAEAATARAAAELDFPLVLSTVSSVSLETVAEILGPTERWFQLYWGRDRELVASLVERAEAAAYSVLVLTVDASHPGWRERDIDNAFLPFLNAQGLANFFTDPVFREALEAPPEEDLEGAVRHFSTLFIDPGISWQDLDFLRRKSRLPIYLKGILSADDARQALDLGIDGIIVSNHGGRQLDGAIAALDALPEVAAAIGGRCPLLFDSGIRRGSDVVKAIALGAEAVLFGRPWVYGLAIDGQRGVREVLSNLLADLELSVALTGCQSILDIDRRLLRPTRP